jgi:hypothetical protein
MGLCLCFLAALPGAGCTIKRTIKTKVPDKILEAKMATLEDLFLMFQGSDKIQSLSSFLEVTFSFGKRESGIIQEIRKQPGYILLRRPDSVRLVVQNFVTKTKELELLSIEDSLSLWIRKGNRLYLGKNSAGELIAEESAENAELNIPVRGSHVFEAIFPQSLKAAESGIRYSKEEAGDSEAKYYVLGFYRDGANQRMLPIRKLWIERSSLTISRQQIYSDDGQIISDISYSRTGLVEGHTLPLSMHIDRPLDGYALDLEFKSWRINPDLPEFVLTPPDGAQIIHLKDKKAL